MPFAVVNATRPTPPGASRSKHSAGLSVRRARPRTAGPGIPVVMATHLRRSGPSRVFILMVRSRLAHRPEVPVIRAVPPCTWLSALAIGWIMIIMAAQIEIIDAQVHLNQLGADWQTAP